MLGFYSAAQAGRGAALGGFTREVPQAIAMMATARPHHDDTTFTTEGGLMGSETKAVVLSRADEITLLHGEIEGALRLSVEKAIRVGELLTEQKAELEHGQWLPWLEAEFPFSQHRAQQYMRVARHQQWLPQGKCDPGSDLTIGAALNLLAEPEATVRPEPEAKPEAAPKARARRGAARRTGFN